ncbi:MAG TPA: NADH-quinone oxidoreductase subunit J [Acidimicrobiales bacterium]|nr:NADH-quinone oxidoreductase subunit J [Acidimicrobiales bacterium]
MSVELVVFVLAGAVCLGGALGVVLSTNPVHAALSLVATLFGVAVLFVAQEANFLAVVQVIVYAGAIVVLFLFVIMLLGVDQADDLRVEPLVGQRVAAGVVSLAILGLIFAALDSAGMTATGVSGTIDDRVADVNRLGESLFTTYLFAFEVTSVLLVIAVVGAVLLARRAKPGDEIVDPGQEERAEQVAERMADARAHVGAHEFWPHGDEGRRAAGGDGEDVDEHEEVRS